MQSAELADKGRQAETELTTVVLDGDVLGRQLVLASHTNEQRTSSPAGKRMEAGGREEMGRGRRREGVWVSGKRIRLSRHTTVSVRITHAGLQPDI